MKKFAIFLTSALLAFLLSSCSKCVESHEKFTPSSFRYDCGIDGVGDRAYCGYKLFFDRREQVCDRWEEEAK